MANPITWRTISTSTPNPSSLLAGAGQSMNNTFKGISSALDSIEDSNDKRDADNTAEFQDLLASRYKTPEELNAAIESGAIDSLRSQYGKNIDANVAREAPANYLKQLQTRTTADATFKDGKRTRSERGTTDNIQQLISGGKFDEAQTALDENELLNESPLHKLLADARVKKSDRNETLRQRGVRQLNDARTEEEYQRGESLKDYTSQYTGLITNAKSERWEAVNKIAGDMGIPLKNGVPDVSQLSPDQMHRYRKALADSGVDDTRADTAGLNSLRDVLRNDGYIPSEVEAAVSEVETGLAGQRSLSVADQQAMQTEQNIAQAVFDKRVAANPQVAAIADPYTTAADLIDFVNSEDYDPNFWFNTRTNAAELAQEVQQAMTKGVHVNGKYIEVTPGMVKLALTADQNQGKATNLVDRLKDMMTDDSGEVSSTFQDQFDEAMKLRKGITGTLKSIENRYLSSAGIKPLSVGEHINAIDRYTSANR